ncbi:MAG: phosphotransferase [Bdellovibrionales bacterium]
MADHSEIIAWARQQLNAPQAVATLVVQAPWSTVLRVNTGERAAYLKQTSAGLFIEASVLRICHDTCGIKSVPCLIAADAGQCCFLMEESGHTSLREFYNGNPDTDLLMKALQIYRELQRATAPHIDAFLQAGVPDWRLHKLSAVYDDMASNDVFMTSLGLEAADIKAARDISGKLEKALQELDGFGIAPCLNHADLHDANMLLNKATGAVTIIDIGETVVEHPFLSLTAFLKRLPIRYPVLKDTEGFKALHAACFSGWGLADADLQAAEALAWQLLPLYSILVHTRLVNLSSKTTGDLSGMQDRVKRAFPQLVENLTG